MDPEKLPHVTLAQAILNETIGILEKVGITIDGQERRILVGKYSEILRPVCKAAEEAFGKSFDEGVRKKIENILNLAKKKLQIFGAFCFFMKCL